MLWDSRVDQDTIGNSVSVGPSVRAHIIPPYKNQRLRLRYIQHG